MSAGARQPRRRAREFWCTHEPPVAVAAPGINENNGPNDERRMSSVRLYQLAVIVGFVSLLEVLCLLGFIDKITMPPPHVIVRDLFHLVATGRYFAEIGSSMANVMLAFMLAFAIGTVTGTILHGYKIARNILDPLFATYYAVPIF